MTTTGAGALRAAWLLGLSWLLATLVSAAEPTRPGPPAQPRRLALVIGNAAYAGQALPNPLNDARDMAGVLRKAGFEVILRENLGLREMHLALREFGDRLRRETLGLFYFAGHGVQVRGRNFLLPVDADIGREDEVAFNALDLQAVLEKMDTARNHTNLVILDACRNNPFAARFRLANNGLAQIDAPPGTVVAFATAPGAVADDGRGRNGLYTRHLLTQLAKPGVHIEEAFKRVRTAVRAESKGRQTPWESTSLESELILAPAAKPRAAPPIAPVARTSRGATSVPVGAAPRFAVGDWWAWRTTNQLTGEVRNHRRQVVSIDEQRVVLDNGTVRDHSGNTLRETVAGRVRRYTPSTLTFLFPLTPGLAWSGKAVEQGEDYTTELETRIRVVGEEELATPAGRMKAVRVERSVAWTNRRTGSTGIHQSTYWYSARAKSPVRIERSNATSAGRVFLKETQELTAFAVS